ncbi:ATPase, F1/V1/A1 complex, alpha/beta subunit [Tanacetum coccineum]
MSDDGSNKGGNDEIVGMNTGKGDGFVGDLYGDSFPKLNSQIQSSFDSNDNEYASVNENEKHNVNISCKMHANEVVDDVNANVDMCFDVDMTDNVEMHVNNVDDSVKSSDKNALKSVDNVQTSLNKNVNYENDELLNKEMRSAKGESSDSGSRNDVWNKKFADIFIANKLDNKLLEIPTEMGKNGNEFVVFNEEVLKLGCEKWKSIDMFTNGPWMVKECTSLSFMMRAEPSKLCVWVKLLNVPMEAWNLKGISALASSLGKPIIMDDITINMCLRGDGRIGFAIVLVELDVGKMIKDKIDLSSPFDTVVEGLMSNVPNEGSIYKFRDFYGITVKYVLRRNHADVDFHYPCYAVTMTRMSNPSSTCSDGLVPDVAMKSRFELMKQIILTRPSDGL